VKRAEAFHCRRKDTIENKIKNLLVLTGNGMKNIKLPELSYQHN
jgi:hypothetical protein